MSLTQDASTQLDDRAQRSTLYVLIVAQAERNPDAVAIAAPGRTSLTYGNLRQHVEDTASRLNDLGIGRGDRVALVLPNGPEMAVAFVAIASVATGAPLNPGYRASEFEFYLSDIKAKALIIQTGQDTPAIGVARALGIPVIELVPEREANAGLFKLVGDPAPRIERAELARPSDVALVLHTSGTTARPKLVPLTHTNLCASGRNLASVVHLTERDRSLNIMQLFHSHGLGMLVTSLWGGGSFVCTPGFYAPRFFEWMDECHPTWYSAAPAIHQAILARSASNRDIITRNPLRFIRSSSASLPPQVISDLETVFNAPVIESYGLTEASKSVINPMPPLPRKLGSAGLATGSEVAIMDPAGSLLPAGIIGEIVIRGDNVTQGYENNPEANAQAFTNGWFRSGDLGYLDADGYLFVTGRVKEQINRAGQKVSPREVEEVLMDHPTVAQVVTFAVPDTRLGEDVAAAVVLRDGDSATARELREFAAVRLADYKVPRRVVFVDEIPLGTTGKIERIAMAAKLGLTPSAQTRIKSAFASPRTPTEARLAEIWAQVLGLDRVGVHDDFLDLGGDSMLATQIFARVREEFGIEMTMIAFFDMPTIALQAKNIQEVQHQTDEVMWALREVEDLSEAEARQLLAEEIQQYEKPRGSHD